MPLSSSAMTKSTSSAALWPLRERTGDMAALSEHLTWGGGQGQGGMASQQLVAIPEAEWHQTGVGEHEGFKEEAVFALGLEGVEGSGTGPGHPHVQTPGAEA